MVVHETALWILLGVCGFAGVVERLLALSADDGRPPWREAPLRRAGVVLEAATMGLGIGFAAASALFLLAALWVRLGL